jgi:Spy/CpxP family protein refolding chaperone
MKIRSAVLLSVSFLALHSSLGWAQWAQPLIPERRTGERPQSLRPEDLKLTNKQIKQMESTQNHYLRDMRALRNELLNKKYELRRLLSNPNSKASEIRSKQQEVFVLENQVQERILDYQLKVREILTPQQFKLWVSRHGMPSGHRMHHGSGMGPMHHEPGTGRMHE